MSFTFKDLLISVKSLYLLGVLVHILDTFNCGLLEI